MTQLSLKTIIDAEVNNGFTQYTFRKLPSQASIANTWYDLAIAPGNPSPKYWFDASPLVAQQVKQSTDGGLFHGSAASPSKKYLRQMTYFQTSASATSYAYNMILADYLLYYPSIDESTTDTQVMDNTNTLPRYTDGRGVQVMAVTLASRIGGQSFSFTYTNQDGVSGRVSQTVRLNAYPAVGTIATCDLASLNQSAPFIGLQDGDYGVRSIESVTMNGTDVGLFALVLVKPICRLMQGINAISAYSVPWMQLKELDLLWEQNSLPEIVDDAFLGIISSPNSTLHSSVNHYGSLKVITI